MSLRPPPRIGLLFARLLPDDCEALVGDLVEGYHAGRSRWWFWCQLLGAILTQVVARRRAPHRVAIFEDVSVRLAILVLLAFEIVVAATRLDQLFARASFAWATQVARQGGTAFLGAVSFAVALAVAALLSRARRLVVVIGCGASAAAIAFITLHVVHPMAPRPFMPSAGAQLGAAAVLVCGLLAGLRLGLRRV
jgi:hypothetical protein